MGTEIVFKAYQKVFLYRNKTIPITHPKLPLPKKHILVIRTGMYVSSTDGSSIVLVSISLLILQDDRCEIHVGGGHGNKKSLNTWFCSLYCLYRVKNGCKNAWVAVLLYNGFVDNKLQKKLQIYGGIGKCIASSHIQLIRRFVSFIVVQYLYSYNSCGEPICYTSYNNVIPIENISLFVYVCTGWTFVLNVDNNSGAIYIDVPPTVP